MNLYELNKAGYGSIPSLSKEEEKKAISLIHEYLSGKSDTHYMMLNHDVHYYTLFRWESCSSKAFAEEVFNIAKSLGAVKSVELATSGEMVEIWITNIMTNQCYMYGFFPYDEGVIEV